MNLQKNLAAKVGALVASLLALAGTFVLVHRNPPASADAAPSSAATSAAPAAPARRTTAPSSSTLTQRTRTHTRTHVS